MQWVLVHMHLHMSYICLANYVQHRKLQNMKTDRSVFSLLDAVSRYFHITYIKAILKPTQYCLSDNPQLYNLP